MSQPATGASIKPNDDQSTTDVGGFAPAKHYCSHIGSALTIIADANTFPDISINSVPECSIDKCNSKENWICLNCSKILCGRYGNQHMIKHYDSNNTHCIALGVNDLSFWCYQCNDYLHHLSIKEIFDIYKIAHIKKFGEEIPKSLQKECQFNDYNAYDFNNDSDSDSDSHSDNDNINPQNNPLTTSGMNKNVHNVSSGKDTVLKDDQKEYFDTDDVLKEKAIQVANLIKSSKYTVIHSGAGIATSANLPDYRGPNGIWTLKAKGININSFKNSSMKIEDAIPTYSHMALVSLIKNNLLQYVVSTNVDGLHLKSGIPLQNISEIHGNIYMEYCNKCGSKYYRNYNVQNIQKSIATIASLFTRFTGRECNKLNCCGKLRDSIISFGENLPVKELNKSLSNSLKADLNIVIGSSMRVQPACNIPLNGKKFILINLQKTPYDNMANVRIWAKCDKFIKLVMDQLNINGVAYNHNYLNDIKTIDDDKDDNDDKDDDNDDIDDIDEKINVILNELKLQNISDDNINSIKIKLVDEGYDYESFVDDLSDKKESWLIDFFQNDLKDITIFDKLNDIIKQQNNVNDKTKKSQSTSTGVKSFDETLAAVDNMEKKFRNMVDGFAKVTQDLNKMVVNRYGYYGSNPTNNVKK